MNILFRREQFQNNLGRVRFKLWGKLDLDEEELHLIDTYEFRGAVLVGTIDQDFIKQCLWFAGIAALIASAFFLSWFGKDQFIPALTLGVITGAAVGYWRFHELREIIFVRDLLHGRTFRCRSVVALAQKEAKLDNAAYALRQVLESAKQWDGTETNPVEALPKDEAKQFILQAFPDVS